MTRKKTFILVSILFMAISFVATISSAPTVHAKDKFRWKIQSAYPRGDVSMALLDKFAENVDKMSNGRLKISVFADPEIVPGEQLFESTKRGTLDMLHGLGAMWAGLVPVGEVEFGIPYAYHLTEQKSFTDGAKKIRDFFYESGFVDLLRKEYAKQGLYWLDLHTYGPGFILSTKPIKTCDDFKGLKISAEGSFNEYYNKLGAGGAIVSGTETYMALKLGTLDAAQWDVSAVTALKWQEVAPYRILGGENLQSIGHMLVNMESWEELPGDLKTVVTNAAKEYFDELVEIYDGELKKVENLQAKGDVISIELPNKCIKNHEKAALEIWKEISKRDPANAQAIEMIKTWRGLE
jgi:TRAP-type mannitol/chloroaromatic compound transport system substrate-binding protein